MGFKKKNVSVDIKVLGEEKEKEEERGQVEAEKKRPQTPPIKRGW